MKTGEHQQPTRSNNSTILILVVVLVIGWVLLRMYAQNGLKTYNECYMRAANTSERVRNATIAAGATPSDAARANFDIYANQVDNCYNYRPHDLILLITGASAE